MQVQLLKLTRRVSGICKRDLGIFAPAMQKASDPIQQLFLDKIREYKSKSSGPEGNLTPEMKKQLENDKQRVLKQYNTTAEDLTKFPTFDFTDPKIQKYEI